MSPAVVLAIVVATHNVDDQATEAMRATAAEALGGEDTVVVRELDAISDAEALRIERRIAAQAVAQVEWLDPEHTRARVRVHAVENNRWVERVITFAVVDTSVERGRALGFAVTSMLPEEVLAAHPHIGGRDLPGADPNAGRDLGTALSLVFLSSTGFGGTAGGVGGGLSGEFGVTPVLSARIGFGGRRGAVPSLNGGSNTAISGAVGLSFWPRRPSPERRIAFGLRVDALAIYHSVCDDRSEALEPGRCLSKTLPGMDALAEVGISLTRTLQIVASAGLEAVILNVPLQAEPEGANNPGMTGTATTPAEHLGNIPPLRAVGEVGIRLSF